MSDELENRHLAVAILIFGESVISPSVEGSGMLVEGAKHFLLVEGRYAKDVYSKALQSARELEDQLTEMAEDPWVSEVNGPLGPYTTTKFLGFQDIRWSPEPAQDGAVLYCGPSEHEGTEIPVQFEIQRRRWYGAPSWCLVEIDVRNAENPHSEPTRGCMMVIKASGPEEAIQKAHRLVRQSASFSDPSCVTTIRQITMIDDPDLEDGAELLYFTARKANAAWCAAISSPDGLTIFRQQWPRGSMQGPEIEREGEVGN